MDGVVTGYLANDLVVTKRDIMAPAGEDNEYRCLALAIGVDRDVVAYIISWYTLLLNSHRRTCEKTCVRVPPNEVYEAVIELELGYHAFQRKPIRSFVRLQ